MSYVQFCGWLVPISCSGHLKCNNCNKLSCRCLFVNHLLLGFIRLCTYKSLLQILSGKSEVLLSWFWFWLMSFWVLKDPELQFVSTATLGHQLVPTNWSPLFYYLWPFSPGSLLNPLLEPSASLQPANRKIRISLYVLLSSHSSKIQLMYAPATTILDPNKCE